MNKLIIANFKMNLDNKELKKWAKEFKKRENELVHDVIICPPYVSLDAMVRVFKKSKVEVAAQNCSDKEIGAYTGKTSAKMIKSVGADYVLLGHNERRKYNFETDQLINEKLKQVLKNKMKAIVCLSGNNEKVERKQISKQLKTLLKDVNPNSLILAYEPAFAIGTGVVMEIKEIKRVLKIIKSEANKILGYEPRVLYGGSVTSKVVKNFLSQKEIDGLLVGSASNKPSTFAEICLTPID